MNPQQPPEQHQYFTNSDGTISTYSVPSSYPYPPSSYPPAVLYLDPTQQVIQHEYYRFQAAAQQEAQRAAAQRASDQSKADEMKAKLMAQAQMIKMQQMKKKAAAASTTTTTGVTSTAAKLPAAVFSLEPEPATPEVDPRKPVVAGVSGKAPLTALATNHAVASLPSTVIQPPAVATPLAHSTRQQLARPTAPTDPNLLRCVTNLVEFILKSGLGFEEIVRTKNVANPLFHWLVHRDEDENSRNEWRYYQMLLKEKGIETDYNKNVDFIDETGVAATSPIEQQPHYSHHQSMDHHLPAHSHPPPSLPLPPQPHSQQQPTSYPSHLPIPPLPPALPSAPSSVTPATTSSLPSVPSIAVHPLATSSIPTTAVPSKRRFTEDAEPPASATSTSKSHPSDSSHQRSRYRSKSRSRSRSRSPRSYHDSRRFRSRSRSLDRDRGRDRDRDDRHHSSYRSAAASSHHRHSRSRSRSRSPRGHPSSHSHSRSPSPPRHLSHASHTRSLSPESERPSFGGSAHSAGRSGLEAMDAYYRELAAKEANRSSQRTADDIPDAEEDDLSKPFHPRSMFAQAPPGVSAGGGGPHRPLDASNVGHRMLARMGWSEGTGLGKQRNGMIQPIQAETRAKGLGVGAGATRLEEENFNDDFVAFQKRKMNQYKHRPNPMVSHSTHIQNNPRKPY